jgi:hypothetical protein
MIPTFTVSYQAASLEEFRNLMAEYGERIAPSVSSPADGHSPAYGEILEIIGQSSFRLRQTTITRLGLQGATRGELEADLLARLQAGLVSYVAPIGFQLVTGGAPNGEEMQGGNPPPPDDGEETF